MCEHCGTNRQGHVESSWKSDQISATGLCGRGSASFPTYCINDNINYGSMCNLGVSPSSKSLGDVQLQPQPVSHIDEVLQPRGSTKPISEQQLRLRRPRVTFELPWWQRLHCGIVKHKRWKWGDSPFSVFQPWMTRWASVICALNMLWTTAIQHDLRNWQLAPQDLSHKSIGSPLQYAHNDNQST